MLTPHVRRNASSLGIGSHILPGNVFPILHDSEQLAEGHALKFLQGLSGADINYKSYDEFSSEADDLFRKE